MNKASISKKCLVLVNLILHSPLLPCSYFCPYGVNSDSIRAEKRPEVSSPPKRTLLQDILQPLRFRLLFSKYYIIYI